MTKKFFETILLAVFIVVGSQNVFAAENESDNEFYLGLFDDVYEGYLQLDTIEPYKNMKGKHFIGEGYTCKVRLYRINSDLVHTVIYDYQVAPKLRLKKDGSYYSDEKIQKLLSMPNHPETRMMTYLNELWKKSVIGGN